MWYHYRQNNSGGHFYGHVDVYVEADSPEEADQIAVEKGDIYFDGVDKGMDCECCGDRWHPASEWDARDVPSKYGHPITEEDGGLVIPKQQL